MENKHLQITPNNGLNPSPNIGPHKIGEIEKTLLWAFALTGLKKENYPDPIQLDVLIDFIATNYPTHSTGEIRHAFNLAVAGKLEIDANHYQSFSAAYVARILSGYVPVRVRGQKSLQSNANGLKIDSQNMATPDEKENIRKNYISECLIKPWKFFVRTGQLTFGIAPMRIIYETLTDDLKILTLTNGDKKRLWLQAEKIELKKLEKQAVTMGEFRKLEELKKKIQENGTKDTIGNDIRATCYELAVHEFYHHCKSTGVDLADIIEKKL